MIASAPDKGFIMEVGKQVMWKLLFVHQGSDTFMLSARASLFPSFFPSVTMVSPRDQLRSLGPNVKWYRRGRQGKCTESWGCKQH